MDGYGENLKIEDRGLWIMGGKGQCKGIVGLRVFQEGVHWANCVKGM